MTFSDFRSALPFLALQLSGTLCSSMIVPFMGYFIVEDLENAPLILSVYSVLVVALTLFLNKRFAKAMDAGNPVFPLIGIAVSGYLMAACALSLSPTLWVTLTFGVVGFSFGFSAVSTMFTLSRSYAEAHKIPTEQFNAFMRATTSTGWMMGPALSFVVADSLGAPFVFRVCAALVVIWLTLWWHIVPRNMTSLTKSDRAARNTATNSPLTDRPLYLAALVCFCLSTAHSLTFSALPLFYVQEVNLPTFAPGLHFSIKTFVEIFAILSTPYFIERFGVRLTLGGTLILAIVAIEFLAQINSLQMMMLGAAIEGLYYGFYASLSITFVQSFANGRFARATAIYWNTLMVSGLIAGPLVGAIGQYYSFQTVIQLAALGAVLALGVLVLTRALTAPQPSDQI